jgi:hypothetical protein
LSRAFCSDFRLPIATRYNRRVPRISYSEPEVLAFVVLPALLVAALTLGIWVAKRRAGEPGPRARKAAAIAAVAAAVWMAVTWGVAASGVLRRWDATPPPFGLLVLAILLIAFRIAFSKTGRQLALHLPLPALVAVQGFRYPLELAMHRMHERGIMPVQMSYSGFNFDIVTGIGAVLVAGFIATGRAGRALVLVWNILGLLLLANVVLIAILSTPRFHYFGDEQPNVWITYPPFVWLPAVMVLAALAGHLLIFRALALQRS